MQDDEFVFFGMQSLRNATSEKKKLEGHGVNSIAPADYFHKPKIFLC